MTTTNDGPVTSDGPPSRPLPSSGIAVDSTAVPAYPARADGVQLLGESKGSGYREAPSLIRRADGQTLQLTRLLYLILEAADGTRSLEDIARVVSPVFGRQVSADNVSALVQSQLLPLGLLRLADGAEPEVKRSDPLLGMRFRFTVTDPAVTRRITSPFTVLFHPVIVAMVTVAFLACCWWVLLVKGLASATHNAFENPGLLLLVFAVTVLSAGFHEFGHAAAAMRGGAVPGRMGAGLYLVWPAFFTDVTDSYHLGRGGRLRTDLGGLYFNAIAAVVVMAVWLMTRDDAWLLIIVTQVLQMVRQLLPLLRFDGYHILADATGVPDLFQRIKPTLAALLPWRRSTAEARALKTWARAVVTVWVLVTVPLLLISTALLVIALPRVLGTAWTSAGAQYVSLTESVAGGDFASAAVRGLALVAIALPVLGIAYMLIRLARQVLQGIWRRTQGSITKRGVAMVAMLAVLAAVAGAWWPTPGTYAPVQPYERGSLLDAAPTLLTPAGSSTLVESRPGRTVALWPDDRALPTRNNPQLSLVLVPRPAKETPAGMPLAPEGENTTSGVTPSWVFPFDHPAPSEEDGNQALAVNTKDGSVIYDVAFALVWADGGETVDTKNEAYAFASCTGCAAVAVGFQVVLVLGQADVVIPENLSAAANYNCISCVTYALASQLVLTLDGPLSADGMTKLGTLWKEIAEFGQNLHNVPLSEIQARLAAYKERIVGVIRADPSATRAPTAESPEATPTEAQTPSRVAPTPPATSQTAQIPGANTERTVPPTPAAPASAGSAEAPGAQPTAPAPAPTTAATGPVAPAPTPAPTMTEAATSSAGPTSP